MPSSQSEVSQAKGPDAKWWKNFGCCQHTTPTRGIVASHTSKKFSPRHPQFAYKSSLTYWNSNKLLLPSYFCCCSRVSPHKFVDEENSGLEFFWPLFFFSDSNTEMQRCHYFFSRYILISRQKVEVWNRVIVLNKWYFSFLGDW